MTIYTKQDIDKAYILGVFNAGGIDVLQRELNRLKLLGTTPHQIIDAIHEMRKKDVSEAEPNKNWSVKYMFDDGTHANIQILAKRGTDAILKFRKTFPQYQFVGITMLED